MKKEEFKNNDREDFRIPSDKEESREARLDNLIHSNIDTAFKDPRVNKFRNMIRQILYPV